jgi:hypothetical protein
VRTLAGEVALEVPSAFLVPQSGTTVFPEVVWYSTALISLKVPLDQLAVGDYTLELRDPDGQVTRRERALSRVEVPPVVVAQVTPEALCIEDANSSVSVQGTGFLAGATVSIRDGSGAVVLRPVAVVGAAAISVTLGAQSLMPGSYTLVVENPVQAGCAVTAAAPLVITPPPSITKTSGNVCSGGGQIMVSGSGLASDATVELREGGMRLAATSVTVTAPDQAVVTFPANDLPKNSRGDLYWHNADGCANTLTAGVRIKPGTGGCN